MNKKIMFLCFFPILTFAMEAPLPPSQKTILNVLLQDPEILGQRMQNTKINLSGLGLTSLNGIREIPGIESITILDLSNNALTYIPSHAFEFLPRLKVLHLNNNKIARIDWQAFANLVDLQELILDNNKLNAVGGEFIDRDLSSLKKLGLAHNEILKINAKAFKDLHHLEVLDLSNNDLPHLSYIIFEPLSQLRFLDVSGNKYLRLIPSYKAFILKRLAPGAEING